MRRLTGSTLFLLASAGWASAELGPLEAAAILAEAKAANAKCKVLNATEAENLGLFTARAEVAAVGAATPEAAGPQLHDAQQRGRASACDAATKARVREIYGAASEAMAAVDGETPPPAAGPVNILPQPLSVATIQPAPRPAPRPAPLPAPQPLMQAQPQPQLLAPAPAPAPAPVPQAPRYNFSAQQPQAPQPRPQYVYAEPQPVPAPQPQYVPATPAPAPQPVYVAPAPVQQYVYAQPQYTPPQPQPQPILDQRFLARFSVVLERPEPQPVIYQTPVAVYTPEPVYAPASDVTGGLDHYARRASAYYVEIRCQHLNPQQAQQFWQSIATEHAAMLERETPSAIETALAQSRAQADQMACSSQSAQFVQQAFQGF